MSTVCQLVMTCPDCLASLDGVPAGQPCPNCGGSRRDAHVAATVHVGVAVYSAAVEVEPDPHRPWFQKWFNVLQSLAALDDAYLRTPAGGNVEVDARVERFFGECNDMRDWLKADHVNLPLLADKDVDDHANGDPDLRVGNGMANTHKHHTVTRGKDPVTARIQRTRASDSGASATLHYRSPSDPTDRQVDAQTLAHDCVASWRAFFNQHQIAEQ